MDFERAKPIHVKFSLPDTITVRQQLAYYSACSGFEDYEKIERWWAGARDLIEPGSWSCDVIPDPKTLELDSVTDPRITDVIIWASVQVRSHVGNLGTVPKN